MTGDKSNSSNRQVALEPPLASFFRSADSAFGDLTKEQTALFDRRKHQGIGSYVGIFNIQSMLRLGRMVILVLVVKASLRYNAGFVS